MSFDDSEFNFTSFCADTGDDTTLGAICAVQGVSNLYSVFVWFRLRKRLY